MKNKVLEFEKPIVKLEKKLNEMRDLSATSDVDMTAEINKLEKKLEKQIKKIHPKPTRWQRVQLARHPRRPYTMDYVNYMTSKFIELHGDRHFADDKSIIAGLATME